MFRARTVIVVGAGASAEFGFPLGGQLLREIARLVDISYEFGQLKRGDYILADALRRTLNANDDNANYNAHLHSAWQIVRSSMQGISIDNVLDALEDPKASLVGKYGIVRAILSAENTSPLKSWSAERPDDIDFPVVSKTWIEKLTKILAEGKRVSQISSIFDGLSIINFNYDRNIEQFLPFSLANYFGVRPQVVQEIFSELSIFRPYGKAGSLPWQDDGSQVAYGRCDAEAVRIAAGEILTFTEQIADRDLVIAMKNAIAQADRLIFLGFGFHRQNLSLFDCKAQPHLQVFATSLGISKPDCGVITEEIERCLGLSEVQTLKGHDFVHLFPLECDSFMNEIWRTLTSEPGEDPTFEMPRPSDFRMPNFLTNPFHSK